MFAVDVTVVGNSLFGRFT